MAWLKVRGYNAYVNRDSGVKADVALSGGLWYLRIGTSVLEGTGFATEQEALDYLGQILQGYTLP